MIGPASLLHVCSSMGQGRGLVAARMVVVEVVRRSPVV